MTPLDNATAALRDAEDREAPVFVGQVRRKGVSLDYIGNEAPRDDDDFAFVLLGVMGSLFVVFALWWLWSVA